MIHKCYKVTGPDGEPCHGGSGKWIPGEWREEAGTKPCKPGMMHVCKDARQLLDWLNAEIWEAEYDDAKLVIDHDDKLAVQRARVMRKLEAWNERTARLFACECAETVLPIYEKACPNDNRPRKAIETARLFADGKASREELAAAWAAAWAAAGAAAWEAAWAAAWAAAGEAAGAAAREAAGEAAGAAAWAAAREAAWAAAWAAARAAAWEAAGEAAGEAAWDAQAQRLAVLCGVQG